MKALGVRICSAVLALRIHACGLSAAMRLKPAHNAEMRSICAGSVSPRAWRMAFSKIGYICMGCAMPRCASMRWRIFSSSPKRRSGVPAAVRHGSSMPARFALGLGAAALGAGQYHDASFAALDFQSRRAEHGLHGVAAPHGDAGLGARAADGLGNHLGWILVRPHAADHAHRIRLSQERWALRHPRPLRAPRQPSYRAVRRRCQRPARRRVVRAGQPRPVRESMGFAASLSAFATRRRWTTSARARMRRCPFRPATPRTYLRSIDPSECRWRPRPE